MKRTLLIVMVALVVLTGAYGIARSSPNVTPMPPHTDYRTGYAGGCGGGAACHTVNNGTFLPKALDQSRTPSYTSFCLSCHNVTGEAHEKAAGAPSTNQYVNLTGIDKTASYKGVSHNWKGLNGNAGTVTPAFPVFTAFMPGGVVECRTCHTGSNKTNEQEVAGANGEWIQAADQGDHQNYLISGFGSTKQYLAQYLKVFRSNLQTSPASQAKKAYQIYTGFTYNYQTATIHFNTPQNLPTGYSIYANIGEPYFRVSNQSNAACRYCHADRAVNSVPHSPGTGAKSNHPAVVKYGYNFGLHSTLMPTSTGKAYLEYTSTVGDRVLCTSCHDPHNAASNNGQLLRETDGSALCADCHKTKLQGYSTTGSVNAHNGSKHSSPTACLDCHVTHGSNNILMIKNSINGQAVNFQNFSGANSFGNGTGNGLCEVCHSGLGHHNAGQADSGHHDSDNCTKCHSHSSGFQAGSCSSCHGFPPPPAPTQFAVWSSSAEKHVAHMGYLSTKFSVSGTAACAMCHGATMPRANHNSGAYGAAIIDTTGWGGGTFNPGTAHNPATDSCTNVSCHSSSGTRVWGGSSSTACDSCHEYPGSATNDWTAVSNNGHTIRYNPNATITTTYNGSLSVTHLNVATAYNATLDTYSAVTADANKCGKCHPHTVGNPNATHMDGFIELAPNGYGQGGGNFNIAVSRISGSQVQCTNVSCHFSRTTPNWW